MSLEKFTALCEKLGSACTGSGCGAYKEGNTLYVSNPCKGLSCCDFVQMDRTILADFVKATSKEEAKATLAKAVCGEGKAVKEAPLHNMLPFACTVHFNSALVNGLCCAVNGEQASKELFPGSLWIPYTKCMAATARAMADKEAQIVFLQNNGFIAGGNSTEEVASLCEKVVTTLKEAYTKAGVEVPVIPEEVCMESVKAFAPKLRTLLGEGEGENIHRVFVVASGAFTPAEGVLFPEQKRKCGFASLASDSPVREDVAAFEAQYGKKPVVVSVPGKAVFCAGKTIAKAQDALRVAKEAAKAAAYAKAFGGAKYLEQAELESCCCCGAEAEKRPGRLSGKVAVIIGAAQGFGYGIAEELAAEGAVIVVADMNLEGAAKAAETIRNTYPASEAFAVAVNVSNEESVEAMMGEVARQCGGIDLFVANAGVVRAGSVKEFSLKDWEFVTDINYNGYFLCVKHAARLMAAQTADGGDWLDIVQVNSKSGLEGSNKNGAYAGSKFGGLGLTQSFALELVTDRIKVNSVCPGNYLDGPLWMNPEKGLFVQYLNSGKVPGAKTIEDVKRFYESKVPMNRGCFPKDVAKAILYTVEQKYETGQAIPVTGGQVMLN